VILFRISTWRVSGLCGLNFLSPWPDGRFGSYGLSAIMGLCGLSAMMESKRPKGHSEKKTQPTAP
jgi:hypothetical protein